MPRPLDQLASRCLRPSSPLDASLAFCFAALHYCAQHAVSRLRVVGNGDSGQSARQTSVRQVKQSSTLGRCSNSEQSSGSGSRSSSSRKQVNTASGSRLTLCLELLTLAVLRSSYASLVRRLAVTHARLHLRSSVSSLDVSVAVMIGEEQIALMHGSFSSVYGWNRADCTLGQLSIDRIKKKAGQQRSAAEVTRQASPLDRGASSARLAHHSCVLHVVALALSLSSQACGQQPELVPFFL